MPPEESNYPKDWLAIGDKELKRSKNLLELADLEGAGFNIQQAAEKYLKGFLLYKGWKLRRTHDLEILLNDAVLYDASFEEFRAALRKTTEYYIEERYPFTITSELSESEIKESLAVVEKLANKIKTIIQ